MGDVPEQQDVAEEAKPKSKLPLIIIIFAVLFGIIGAVAFLILGSGGGDDSLASPTPMPTPLIVSIPEKFTVNLAPPDDQYIYTAQIHLQINPKPGTGDVAAVKEFGIEEESPRTKYPLIRDTIRGILSSKTRTEVTTTAGQDKIRLQIKQRLNQILDKSEVTQVLVEGLVPP